MITQLNKDTLYSTFGVNDFNSLSTATNEMAPSMVEYYLSDLSSVSNTDSEYSGLNKRNIENSLSFGDFNIYIDYDENIYLEIESTPEEYETGSLW